MSEMTASDVCLLNGGGWNNWMNNPFMYLIFLRLLAPDGYGYGAGVQGSLTRAELTDGLNNQTMQRDISNVRETVGNVGLMVQDAGSRISDKLCCGFNSVNGANVPVYDKYGNKLLGVSIKTRKNLHAYYATNGATGAHLQLTKFPYCEC